LGINILPHQGKPLIETEFFPHLEPLCPTECPTLDQPMNAAMGKSVLVPCFIESGE
jgi:hypothetical protein